MKLAELWPRTLERWLVHVDESIVVLDKPAGMLALPSDRSTGEDALSRLRTDPAVQRPSSQDRVAAVAPLDRQASGLLLFGRHSNATRQLAQQQQRGLRRRFIVAVESHGRWRTSFEAVRVIAENRSRRLLEIVVSERQQPIRERLAAVGAPVAGDRSHDGPPGWRLMMHVASVSLPHPETGETVTYECPPPPVFERWLRRGAAARYDAESLAEVLQSAAHQRYGLATDEDTTAYRLLHGGGDFLPGVTVDRYRDHLVVALTGPATDERATILDALDSLGPAGIYLKLPPRQASRLVDSRQSDIAPTEPVRGAAAPDPMSVLEHGLDFDVRLGDGLSTGLFLDQRDNRQLVATLADSATVLNLFGYTGAFTAAAIAGGARETVTVDSSKVALARAKALVERLGADPARHRLVRDDAFRYLRRAAKRNDRFDLVVLDPPSFATTKHSRFRAVRDYRVLAADAVRCLAPRGRLLACTNHRGISPAKLRRDVSAAATDAGRTLAQLAGLPPPVDFPPEVQGKPHLKTILLELAD